jgi:MFS family permease
VLAGVPPEVTILTWSVPGIGMGFMYSAVTLVVLRGVASSGQGSATSALQLSDILGTALGTGVAGAMTAFGERSGGDGLGAALAAVFGLSLVVAVAGGLAAGRVSVPRFAQDAPTAAVD